MARKIIDGKQVEVREVDIPDADLQKAPQIKLEPEVATEREVRRYIRKDGVFVKDVEQLFAVRTREINDKGMPVTKLTKNAEEAAVAVTDICEDSGRTIERDRISGRLKAVPGWNLSIHVPGMQTEEQNAPKKPEGETAQKIQSELVVRLQDENKELKSQISSIGEKLDQVLAGQSEKALDQMSHAELDKKAAKLKLTWPEGVTKKEDKIICLHKATHPKE